MQKFRTPTFLKDPIWIRVATLSTVLLFVFLADAVLSYWVPNFLEKTVENTAWVGLIMGFSSVVGLLVDLILPQVLVGVTVRKLVLFSIISSFVFSFSLYGATWVPVIILILFAMAVWGIYYEFLRFAQQQFIADSTPLRYHPAAWGILGVFKASAYFLGPIIAGNLTPVAGRDALYLALLFTSISFLALFLFHKSHDRPLDIEMDKANIFREFEHWVVLFEHVWPVIIMSLVMGIIDASFWTVGAIWNETLSEKGWLGGMFLSSYILPSLFVGFAVAKWGIYKGKKKLAEKFLLVSGVLFAILGFYETVAWQVGVVFLASTLLSAAYPLVEGVYSDIVARMGRERKHMIGLSSSTFSLSYIVGPPLSGFIANLVGVQKTFVVLGVLTAVIAVILILTTPRKLLLPQEEIVKWKD